MIPLFELQKQNKLLASDLKRVLASTLKDGQFILGPEVQKFEQNFARSTKAKYCVGVASGSDALELALTALGVGPGDLVATVSFTFMATVDAILHVGAEPLFIDIDPVTMNMDPLDLEKRIKGLKAAERKRLKVILPVHLFANPCDMKALKAVARKFKLKLVEDAAQAAGAAYDKRPLGAQGDLGCYSFFPSKNLGGLGDGGAVVTNSKVLAEKIRQLRMHGRGPQGKTALGRNSRLDTLQAACLSIKLKHLKHAIAEKRKVATYYQKALRSVPQVLLPQVTKGGQHGYGLYVIQTPYVKEIQMALVKAGVEARTYYAPALHQQPFYKRLLGTVSLPQTEAVAKRHLALPMFESLKQGQVNNISKIIAETVKGKTPLCIS